MNLSNIHRQRLFQMGQNINSLMGILFQNEQDLQIGMIDEEFDKLDSFEAEIQLYRDQLQLLKYKL